MFVSFFLIPHYHFPYISFVSANYYSFSFVKHLGFGFPFGVSPGFIISNICCYGFRYRNCFFVFFCSQSFQLAVFFLLLVGIDWLVNQERNIRDMGNQRQK